ncbi:MAG: type VII toxin-antitoxin system HepT family RNase toxin [Chloroflexota bacterium]
MLDRERILGKIDQLEGYLKELNTIVPQDFAAYRKVETRRACERLLQVSIEAVIDVCHLLVTGLRLGIPAEEDDLFEKVEAAGIISPQTRETLKEMKGFRNILVHEYARIDDRVAYEVARSRLGDFEKFKEEILRYLRTSS